MDESTTTTWYKVTLTGDMAKRHCSSFQQEVFEHHLKIVDDDNVPYPTKAALVFRLIEPPGDSCTYFFSPDAARSYVALVRRYQGVACAKPSASDVELAVGDPPEAERLLA